MPNIYQRSVILFIFLNNFHICPYSLSQSFISTFPFAPLSATERKETKSENKRLGQREPQNAIFHKVIKEKNDILWFSFHFLFSLCIFFLIPLRYEEKQKIESGKKKYKIYIILQKVRKENRNYKFIFAFLQHFR